jgi:hypothetical protein
MATKAQIKNIMKLHVKDCKDYLTGEVNHTLLAEKAANDLNLYIGSDYKIPEIVFDIALEFN